MTPPTRGRPRSEEVRQAIHQAFLAAMLEDGFNQISIDAVAKRAGISRTTIYRWYKDRDEIALEVAIELVNLPEFPKPTGDYQADIRAFFSKTFEGANERGPLFTALMARAQADREFAEQVWQNFSQPRRTQLAIIIQSNPAVADTDQKSEAQLDTLLDLIFGAIWYRMMSGHAPLDKRFIEELCEIIQHYI
ncbi:TetR/AcrR family transcriptional regulator [Maricurvus nonylphenolicus]|uniref:TetR/AcrR family transcriptional regulator n=1 Tax=Maricurvus nonylphenolicus TaxID=1008307 RepID=UPI0036F3D45E